MMSFILVRETFDKEATETLAGHFVDQNIKAKLLRTLQQVPDSPLRFTQLRTAVEDVFYEAITSTGARQHAAASPTPVTPQEQPLSPKQEENLQRKFAQMFPKAALEKLAAQRKTTVEALTAEFMAKLRQQV